MSKKKLLNLNNLQVVKRKLKEHEDPHEKQL